MQTENLLSVNRDYCPEKDNILIRGECGGCKYYKGFELYNGQQCIRCSYAADIAQSETER